MSEIYGGHLVAKYLKDVEGIDTIFSLVGGHIDKIYDGCLEHNLKIIDVRHEQAAAMMAQAWSVYTGKPGVCLVTAGPGFTNVLTGVVNAYMENSPLVVLSGTAPVRDWIRGALQDMKQADMIKSVVKWHEICYDTKRIPEYLATAFRHAVSGRPGPVFLELPPDILNVKVSEDTLPAMKKGSTVYRFRPDSSSILEAVALINQAERPVIMGGNGVCWSDCDSELGEFVDKTGAPFFLMNAGRGALPDDHPQSIWDGGLSAALTAFAMTDLVISLGIRMNWIQMFGETFPQAKVVRVDVEASEIDRNRASDVGLVGDIGLTFREINPIVETMDRSDWVKTLKESYLPLVADEVAARETPSDPIHPARLIEQVRKTVGDDAIYAVDGGDASYFGLVGLKAQEKAFVLPGSGGLFGCLGTGIPFGIGAKVARPDKTVVVITGDGSFGLNAMEFDTAARHNIPFVCVICNDKAWGMIKHGQEMVYGSDRLIGSELTSGNYEKIAEALGGYGELVVKDEEITPAIHRALESGKPACINVLTDPTVTSPATLLFVDGLNME
ncbi:MAG: thiamine pyrophosphate-binding protein [Deltaproteobacteria bacterium]|nr:thiamine pyrophosphate-binding protein [Deltaproteobacteria bacterium]